MGSTSKYSPSPRNLSRVVSNAFSQQICSPSKCSFTLSKLRFFGHRRPKTTSFYSTSLFCGCRPQVWAGDYGYIRELKLTLGIMGKFPTFPILPIIPRTLAVTPNLSLNSLQPNRVKKSRSNSLHIPVTPLLCYSRCRVGRLEGRYFFNFLRVV